MTKTALEEGRVKKRVVDSTCYVDCQPFEDKLSFYGTRKDYYL
jgi:hypothetical protein